MENAEKLKLEKELLFLYKYYHAKENLNEQINIQANKLSSSETILKTLEAENRVKEKQIQRVDELDELIESYFIEENSDIYNLLPAHEKYEVKSLYDLYFETLFSTKNFNGQSVYSLFNGPKNNIDLIVVRIKANKKIPLLKQSYTQETKRYSIVDTGTSNAFQRLKFLLENDYLKGPFVTDDKKMIFLDEKCTKSISLKKHYIDVNLDKLQSYNSETETTIETVKETNYKDIKDFFTTKEMYYDFFGYKIPLFNINHENSFSLGEYCSLYTLYRLGEIINNPKYKDIEFDKFGTPMYKNQKISMPNDLLFDMFPFTQFVIDDEFYHKNSLKRTIIEHKVSEENLGNFNVGFILSKAPCHRALKDLSHLKNDIELRNKKINSISSELVKIQEIKNSLQFEIIQKQYQTFEYILRLTYLYLNEKADNFTDLLGIYKQTNWQSNDLCSTNQLQSKIQGFEHAVLKKINSSNPSDILLDALKQLNESY